MKLLPVLVTQNFSLPVLQDKNSTAPDQTCTETKDVYRYISKYIAGNVTGFIVCFYGNIFNYSTSIWEHDCRSLLKALKFNT